MIGIWETVSMEEEKKLNKVYAMICTTVKESVEEALEIIDKALMELHHNRTMKLPPANELEDDPLTGLRINLDVMRREIIDFESNGKDMGLSIDNEIPDDDSYAEKPEKPTAGGEIPVGASMLTGPEVEERLNNITQAYKEVA